MNNLRLDKGPMGKSSVTMEVVDADDTVIANITSLNGFMKFKRAWAAAHDMKTKNVALVVTCEGGGCQILDSKSAFRYFSADECSNVRHCHVAVSSTLPDNAPRDLGDPSVYDCWRRAA